MKYLELKEQLLNEINMSPGALRRAAAEIGARAGMEFEMIVPGANQGDDDYDDDYRETDYDADESVNSIQDAYDFFYDGDFNSRRDCERLREQMQEEYWEWLGNEFDSRWESDTTEFIYNYLKENASNDEIAEILGREDDDEDTKDNYGKKEVAEAVDKIIEEGYGNYWYDQARESAQEDFNSDSDLESEWLESADINTMQDVESRYNITWPHYFTPERETGGVSIEDAADSFSRGIGREVQASNNYHSRSVVRPSATKLHYVVEPDGSLEADDDNDGGLEFVSPALPIDELLSDLKKVKAWADKTGCYTNDSTGLHINVSVPKWQGDLSKLDYVKLAILMGDEYVLQEFGRQGNTYAKSALKIVKDNIRQRPEDVKRLLDTMKEHLNTSAAKLVHSGSTNKYTSVNTKDGYIEFRSPGGDWLNDNFDKIESTLLRFVVAMDAAVDETKYKEEYAKKLYKLLAGDQKDATNTMVYFAKYAAGELPQSALKSFIKQAQFERSQGKEPDGKKMWYRVDKEGRGALNGASIEVVATSKEEALEKAASEWSVRLSSLTTADAYPVRAFEVPKLGPSNPDGKYVISKFRSDGPNWTVYRFDADTWNKAEWVLKDWLTANNITDAAEIRKYTIRFDPTLAYGQPEGSSSASAEQSTQRYEIYNKQTGNAVEDAPSRVTNDDQALEHLQDYIEHGPHGLQLGQATNMFGIRNASGLEIVGLDIPISPIRARTGEPQAAGSAGQSTNRTDRPFVWKVTGASDSPYQSQGTEVVASSEFEAMQKARQQWDLNTSGATEEEFFRTNSWRATPVRPAPVQGSTQDLQQQRAASGTFTGAWKILDTDTGQELYRFSGIGNSQADANRVAAEWLRRNATGANMTQIEVVPIMS